MNYSEPWPVDELIDVLNMIKSKIGAADYISEEQKGLLCEIVDKLIENPQ